MQKQIAIGVGVILVVLLGFFVLSNKPKVPANTNGGQETQSTSQSLSELLGAGASVECSYTESDARGTFYIANKKVRGAVSMTTEGKTVEANTIIDGSTVYSWIEGMTTGFKTTIDKTAQTGDSQQVNPDKKYNFKCNPWSVDASKFDLPTGINFSNLPVPQPSAPSAGTVTPGAGAGTSASACAACDTLTGAEKTQCKQTLNCK